MKTKIIPFDLKTAKKIQAGEIKGKIVLRKGSDTIRIVCFDAQGGKYASESMKTYMIVLRKIRETGYEQPNFYKTNGMWDNDKKDNRDLLIELPEETPICNNPDSPKCKICSNWYCNDCQYNKREFKPFDKVLVRNKNKRWYPRFYAETDGLLYYTTDSKNWEECIPYEGNEKLAGTTNKPKENKR